MCDAFMTKLMKELDLEIPEFKLHRRMKVSMKEIKKGTFEVVVTGLDVHEDAPYSFIKVPPPPYIFMPMPVSQFGTDIEDYICMTYYLGNLCKCTRSGERD